MTDALVEVKSRLQAQRPYLYEKYGVTEIDIFGSYVRGEQKPDSDIDVLVALTDPPKISLLVTHQPNSCAENKKIVRRFRR